MVRRGKRRERTQRRYRALRAAVGLSQMDAAERAGLGRSRYWRIENGYTTPTALERAKLARIFRVDTAALDPEPVVLASAQAVAS